MRWVWNLHKVCDSGKKCASWVLTTVKQVVDADSKVGGMAMELLENWPYSKLAGVGFDYAYAGLYCFRSGCWLSDDSILAFTQLLRTEYGNNATVFLQSVSSSIVDTGDVVTDVISVITLVKIRECLDNDLTGYIFLPVNFDTNHWACLVINKLKKEIVVYDSMNKRKIGKILKLMAREIDGGLLESAFKHLTMTTPRQKDGDSCGIFVCLQFWRQVSNAAPTDVSSRGLVRVRWEMLQALMNQKAQ
ncbi:hypothetical protein AM587_10014406 [Phytophthora nicotianae]|uniref:Ubiquitin-like protease family profile domain-containing protein n=1 Tax=Phytophthora nicotianae TaxID=4792 RepID=A0A0W8BXD7_PHYNI|nr:hypothetical protein AM587_10014406 [Phytophthora nicotianae]